MARRNNKKGYFFVIDAFIGSTIIFVSLMMILNSNIKGSQLQFDYSMAEDYSTFIMNTKIQDLNNPAIANLSAEGLITNKQNTVMEQIDTFYYDAYYVCTDSTCANESLNYSTRLLENLTDSLISSKYGFSLVLKDTATGRNQTIYERSVDRLNTSQLVIASEKITFIQINSTKMFGPNIVDIKVWI